MKVGHSCLACRDPGSTKCAGTQAASATGVMALSESFIKPLVAGDQKASLASFSVAPPIQALRRLPCLGSFSVVQHVRHISAPSPPPPFAPQLGSYSVDPRVRHLKGHPGWGPALLFGASGF